MPSINTAHITLICGSCRRCSRGVASGGAMSDNVWGAYADNIWGRSLDNVWGGNSTDVWGGVGAGGLWGNKGVKIWGTGNGTNYLRGLTSFLAAFFGLKTKNSRDSLRQSTRNSASSARNSRGGRAPARSGR